VSDYERTTVHFRTSQFFFFALTIRYLSFWHAHCIYIFEGGQQKKWKKSSDSCNHSI